MIVRIASKEEKRRLRVKFYADDVFLIAHEELRPLLGQLSLEELFASAEQFAAYLLESSVADPSLMSYEVQDVEAELNDERDRKLLLWVTFLKLCALRKRQPLAEAVARALVGYCQQDGFTELLAKLDSKEFRLRREGRRADLLTYELRSLKQEKPDFQQAHEVVGTLVENAANYSADTIERLLNLLHDLNQHYGQAFDQEINQLREILKLKTDMTKENVKLKIVQTQIDKVESGATGVINNNSNGN